MTRASFARFALRSAVGVMVLVGFSSASAGDIRIQGGSCTAGVHLVADDAPLSDVLKRLAKALDFELVDYTTDDAAVSIDTQRSPVELIAHLAPFANVSIMLARDPRCPQRERIVKVWVLPGGSKPEARNASMAQKADDEQTKRTQAGIDTVMNAHGVPPAVRPRAERP